MTDPQLSAFVAFLAGFGLAVLLFVPYVAWSYRRRGEFGVGHAVLALGFLVYAMALWTYTLLPVPDTTPEWCARHAVEHAQLRPLRFLADIRREQVGDGPRAWLHNPALLQAVFNVALFVPLGMFGRHLFHRGPLTIVLGGALISLFIELTQYTAVWGLFACPYRLFDVDDLMMNTAGAALGIPLAGLLRLVPWQKVAAPPDVPRPVTTRRRWFGMLVDLLSVLLLGTLLRTALDLLDWDPLDRGDPYGDSTALSAAIIGTVVPAVLLLLVVPLLGNGATIGQRVVLLRPVDARGRGPSVARMGLRFLVGSGGYFLLVGWDTAGGRQASLLALLLLVVSGIMAWRPRDHRGLSGLVAGLYVVDSRGVTAAPEVTAVRR